MASAKHDPSSRAHSDEGAAGAELGSSAPAGPLSEQTAMPWWVRLALNGFILWNLFALTVWLLPGSVLKQSFVGRVHPYMVFTGLAQNWNMFSMIVEQKFLLSHQTR